MGIGFPVFLFPRDGHRAPARGQTPGTSLPQRFHGVSGGSHQHSVADPAPNLCDALLQSPPACVRSRSAAASSISLPNGLSSSGVPQTDGPAPAIVSCSARHKRLPCPALKHGVVRRAGGAPPLSV